jgi:hypothetical protein
VNVSEGNPLNQLNILIEAKLYYTRFMKCVKNNMNYQDQKKNLKVLQDAAERTTRFRCGVVRGGVGVKQWGVCR